MACHFTGNFIFHLSMWFFVSVPKQFVPDLLALLNLRLLATAAAAMFMSYVSIYWGSSSLHSFWTDTTFDYLCV